MYHGQKFSWTAPESLSCCRNLPHQLSVPNTRQTPSHTLLKASSPINLWQHQTDIPTPYSKIGNFVHETVKHQPNTYRFKLFANKIHHLLAWHAIPSTKICVVNLNDHVATWINQSIKQPNVHLKWTTIPSSVEWKELGFFFFFFFLALKIFDTSTSSAILPRLPPTIPTLSPRVKRVGI